MMSDNLAYEGEVWEELIDGNVVLMSPRPSTDHIQTAFNIAAIFKIYLKGKKCRVLPDGTDLYLTEKNHFIPDVMVICDPGKIKRDGVHGPPDLVVEVLSPSSVRYDRIYKKSVYEKCGIQEYWIVNPRDKSIDVYRLENGVYQLADICSLPPDYWLQMMKESEKNLIKTEITPSVFSGLTISLTDIFEDVP